MGPDVQRIHTLMMSVLALIADKPRPSGEVYALLMAGGVTLPAYEQVVRLAVNCELATKSGHLLTATEKGTRLGREYLATQAVSA